MITAPVARRVLRLAVVACWTEGGDLSCCAVVVAMVTPAGDAFGGVVAVIVHVPQLLTVEALHYIFSGSIRLQAYYYTAEFLQLEDLA